MSGLNLACSIALCVVILCVIVVGMYVSKPIESSPAIGTQSLDITKSLEEEFSKRKIIAFEETRPGEVKYTYYGDMVPEAITPDEVPEMRTENSYTRFISSTGEGMNEKYTMELISYPQSAFKKDEDGAWKYIEHATTTKEAIQRRKRSPLALMQEYIVSIAHAVDYYSASGDGYVGKDLSGLGLGLASCLLGDGTNADPADSLAYVSVYNDTTVPRSCTLNRSFLPFDTSSLPSYATVTGATLSVYVISKTNGDNDGEDFITVIETSQANSTTLVLADKNLVGSFEGIDAGNRLDITSISTSAYSSFVMNSTGMTWVKKSGNTSTCGTTAGITCLGLREGHDFNGSALADDQQNSITIYASEQTGTSNDPYLTVTYTVPTMRGLIKGATIKFNGGRAILKSN